MAIVPVVATYGSLIEVKGIRNSRESILNLLESQKALFHSQINEFHRIVKQQCKLTGSNPLAQDIIASSLDHKTGKKSKADLNPKAVKYLESVFSIKDTIGKKETHEISSLCRTTVTQVRDFFKTERSKVKKLVQKSKNLLSTNVMEVSRSFPKICTDITNVISNTPNVIGSISNVSVDFGDKEFVERIFDMMWKEETFSGRVKLMEWVLQIQNKAALSWFSTKGGITILALWLNDAALEEQTTVLSVIFKVFCHIPFDKARPAHMSDILQTVNKLRFYRNPDISKRAKVLLSSWSMMSMRRREVEIARNHLKKVSSFGQDAEDRRGTEPEPEPEPRSGQKLLISSSDALSKRHKMSIFAKKTKMGGKVQLLVEHSDSKLGRNIPIAKASSSNQSHPLSADDIMYMHEKDVNIPLAVRKPLINNQAPPTSNAPQPSQLRINETTKLPQVQIQWCTPPEVLLSSSWQVCFGQNSDELHTQTKRTQGEHESIYQTAHQIPPNPKKPGGSEINYNDALTLVIPIEEHADIREDGTMPAAHDFTEIDLELLRVLLKNPELVEALTRAGPYLEQCQLSAFLELVKKADSSQPIPVSLPRSVTPEYVTLLISDDQAQPVYKPKTLSNNQYITRNLDNAPQHQQPLPMPNHTRMISSNYYQANDPPRTVQKPYVQYPEQPPHLTVPDCSRPEFKMYGRGRWYDQSN